MKKNKSKNELRIHRKRRIRAKISGTAKIPRICVFKSLRFFYAQAIDDEKGNTLASIDSRKSKSKERREDSIKQLGEKLGKLLIDKKIKKAVFDRSGYRYHGKVKDFAEGIRKSGVEL